MNIDTFTLYKSDEETKDSSISYDDISSVKQKIEQRKLRQKKVKALFLGLILAIILLLIATAYSQYRLYTLSRLEVSQKGMITTTSASQTSVSPQSGDQIVQALKRHILVPSGNPQIAEVKDIQKLKETQSFFKDGENGDIVLVYETMIFLYRPSSDIVVAVSDISGVGQVKP